MIQVNIGENVTFFKNIETDEMVATIPLGYKEVAESFFSKFPPTYDEIDRAINVTEEALETIKDVFNDFYEISTRDQYANKVATLAFNTLKNSEGIAVPVVEVENVFTRFANIVKGLPMSQDVIPDDNYFAAYLLIIREITHHLHFERVVFID